MILTKNLSYHYPDTIEIEFPNIELGAGKPLLICGESGCGKSTLLHLLAGLRRPTKGSIMIDDQNVSEFSQAKMDRFRGQNIGIVYQQSYFIESLDLLDNLTVSPFSLQRDKVSTIAERLNIENLLDRYPNQISVGQQQRVSIARAVMNNPKLILADEPTSALDNENCRQVIELLLDEATTNEAALIIVTHDDRLRSEIDNCIELQALAN